MSDTKYTKNSGSLPGDRDVNDFVYDAAYAEPPKDTRFKRGQSGNPAGRPLGSRNKPKILNDVLLTEMLREEYSRPVEVKVGDEAESIPIIRSIIRKRYAAADAGDEKAQLWAIASVREVEARDAKDDEAEFVYAEKYKARFKNIRIGGLSGDDDVKSPVPNPNHIILNGRDRTVTFVGPTNAPEHIDWLEVHDRRFEESVIRAHSDVGEQGELTDAEQPRQPDVGEHEELKDADQSSNAMPPPDPYYEDRIRNRVH